MSGALFVQDAHKIHPFFVDSPKSANLGTMP